MSKQDSLESKIKKELQKTGYPTEIISASVLDKREWIVINNPSYQDLQDDLNREFDIWAYKPWKKDASKSQFTLGVYLLIECKKSEKPWVFFTSPEDFRYYYPNSVIKTKFKSNYQETISTEHVLNALIKEDYIKENHHYFQTDRLARVFHEPFKGQEKNDTSQMIYAAVMSIINATLFHYYGQYINNFLQIFYPVIVFDGNLFEAEVKSNKSISLTKSNHVRLSFNYFAPKRNRKSSSYSGKEKFIVDIIHIDYLDKFIDAIEDEHGDIFQMCNKELNLEKL